MANASTLAGRTVLTYRVTDFTTEGDAEITDASGRLRVTPGGLVVEFAIRLTNGSGETFDNRYAVTGTGGTSVETPGWFQGLDEDEIEDGGGVSRVTQLSIAFDVRDDGRVALTHQAGETVSSLSVRYTADGESVTETWAPDDEITAGVTYTTERAPDPGTLVRVVWESGDRSAVIAEFSVP